mmetsp:Transcript_54385/g.129605  ORF Transcript_54385/g.129605 Transcript_54385/m.129605 type:complete len:836 (+) Transcript_54385:114-2621(+)|eukprot:CAMPEP_0178384358 /NCGR_PEP_ID=MMETSP0689_2-20121128/7474_1 /TAXON_ID=160604 /ORGANISM="Amphidinium massartii, Strain CS-259" /LENGTH=835 /DNA_ID=CAMNT_0020004603 /DNA_START=28 /DNA_END=2535 /DNA_ORIENTATION=+
MTAAPSARESLKVCDEGSGGGLLLPLFGDSEQRWPNGLRIILYLLGLLWCFVGVGVISDVFMSAIEKITSKKRRVKNKQTGRWLTTFVWNETIANLTLMALGSSAPEIMLSVIEILGNEMYTGELGPSTIIGSAAFNLLCISAVCVMAIPDGEVRFIKEVPVYVVTASFSVFAYVWLLVILMGFSPDVVEVWEAVLTAAFLPILLGLAFLADQGYFSQNASGEDRYFPVVSSDMTKDELAEIEHKIRQDFGQHLTQEQVYKIMEAEHFSHHSRAYYRCAATRAVTGQKRVDVRRNMLANTSFKVAEPVATGDSLEEEQAMRRCTVGFKCNKYAVLESVEFLPIVVIREGGPLDRTVSVKFATRSGSAKEGEDFEAKSGEVTFQPGETEKEITIRILDDDAHEQDEEFFVDLSDPVSDDKTHLLSLSDTPVATVLIIDDDCPGILSFQHETLEVEEQTEDYVLNVVVERNHGSTGTVGCKFYTESDTALASHDYEETSGEIEFGPAMQTQIIPVTIKGVGRYDSTDQFRLIIESPRGGATFDSKTDGKEETCICTIIIKASTENRKNVDRMMNMVNLNLRKMSVYHTNWRNQFHDALFVLGGEDEDDEIADKPGCMDYVMHVISMPWKLIFACVPPVDYCGGWATFVCSLMMIAGITAIVSDLASLVGCTIGMPDEVTAITLVALGTSLPDTFASMTAATVDAYADASIGNVTGSNSVNVFLGLGLPWTIASLYWQLLASDSTLATWRAEYAHEGSIVADWPDGAFAVPAGSLWFNLTIFAVNALGAIALLAARRKAFGGELGGPRIPKYISGAILVGQWFIYVIASSIWALQDDD